MAVLALFGPTGVGKTAVAIAVAERLAAQGRHAVAVSADALQVYDGLQILTGAADAADRARLEHRLTGFHPVTASFSAGEYAQLAHAEIDALLAAGTTPIVVGGTGLYLRAALATLDLRPPPPPELRARLAAELERDGSAALHARLATTAPEAAARIQPADAHRVVRALELHELGAGLHRGDQLWTTETRHPTRLVALVMQREALYEAIDARVLRMVAGGAVDEVKRADAAGASETARAALGFGELLDLAKGTANAGELIAMMQQRTRNYARRQLTWLRKLPGVRTIDVTNREPEDVATEILAG